jgi:hypothetical protein
MQVKTYLGQIITSASNEQSAKFNTGANLINYRQE